MYLSHGLIRNAIPVQDIIALKEETQRILSQIDANTAYAKDLNLLSEYIESRALDLIHIANRLLGREDCMLKTAEYHARYNDGSRIPPHQDNFYHCLKNGDGVKILVPLTKLDRERGALIFADVDKSQPVLPHIPGESKHFSSRISESNWRALCTPNTCYQYSLGDISYHYLSSIHWADPNTSNEPTAFLVFRYEPENAEEDLLMQHAYQSCMEANRGLLNAKESGEQSQCNM